MEQAHRIDGVDTSARVLRIDSPGHAFFATTIVALGIIGLVQRDFTPTWSGVAKSLPGSQVLVYLTALVSVVCGVELLWRRTAVTGSRLLLSAFAVWTLAFRIPLIVRAPTATVAWWALGDTAVMAAAAWVLFIWFAEDRERFLFAAGDAGLRIPRILYGLALIPFGIAHFTFLERTASMVPSWLPWHIAWADFTGGAFIVAGIAVVFGVFARLAVTLSAVQLALFTLLVWVPVVVAGPNASQWSEFLNSWALTAGAWVVAESYRGSPWLLVRLTGRQPAAAMT